MFDEVGITLPSRFVVSQLRAMLGTTAITIAVIIGMFLLQDLDWAIIWYGIPGIMLVDAVFFAIIKSTKHVYFSKRGVDGLDESGNPAGINWADEIRIGYYTPERMKSSDTVKLSSFFALGMMHVRIERSGGKALVFPAALLQSAVLIEQLRKHAPAGHPLFAEVEKFQAATR